MIARSGKELRRQILNNEILIDNRIARLLSGNPKGIPVLGNIDKLSVVGSLSNPESDRCLSNKLGALKSDDHIEVSQFWKDDGGYKRITIIRSMKNNERVFRFEHVPRWNRLGFIRLEVSPQHFNVIGMDKAIHWLIMRLGILFVEYLNEAWVTRIDYAIDMFGWRIDDFWVRLSRSKVARVSILVDGVIENRKIDRSDIGDNLNVKEKRVGYRCGSAVSEIYISIYKKDLTHNERIEELALHFDKEKVSTSRSKNTRIEIRYQPGRGKYLLRDLDQVPDILSRVSVYPKHVVKAKIPQELYALMGNRTIFELYISLLGDAKEIRNKENKLLRLLGNCQSNDFFDKEKIIAAWPECVFQLGRLADLKELTIEEIEWLTRKDSTIAGDRYHEIVSQSPYLSYLNRN